MLLVNTWALASLTEPSAANSLRDRTRIGPYRETRKRRGFTAAVGYGTPVYRARAILLTFLASAALLSACTTTKHPAAIATRQQIVYTAVGASESVGVGADKPATEAWPRVLARTALGPDSTFHNVAVSGATAADALRTQVTAALATRPTLVTVWLNVNDLIALVPTSKYEKTMTEIVHALRRNGATQVLVANTPPIEDLPAFRRRFGSLKQLAIARVDEYNAAIARVTESEGAILVDLHAAGVAARHNGTEASLISGDGFHPSTSGHAAIAVAFADAVPSVLTVPLPR